MDAGFLGAAQIDRFGNLNTTVDGGYQSPKLVPGRRRGAQIAAHAREIVVIVRQTLKTFVSQLDFLTSARSKNRTTVVTDLGILESDGESGELMLVSRYPGVDIKQVLDATGWSLRISDSLGETDPPSLRSRSSSRTEQERRDTEHTGAYRSCWSSGKRLFRPPIIRGLKPRGWMYQTRPMGFKKRREAVRLATLSP